MPLSNGRWRTARLIDPPASLRISTMVLSLSHIASGGPGKAAARLVTSATILLAALCPFFLGTFQLELVGLALLYGLLAFGLDIAWGRAGIVSIGQAVFFGIGAYGVGIAVTHNIWVGFGWLGALALAIAIAAAIGAAGLRPLSSPSTMAVLTLATTLLAERIAISWTAVTGGSNGLFVMPPEDTRLYYWMVLALIVAVVFAINRLVVNGRVGNRLTATRLNERRAEHLGIRVYRVRLLAFVIGAGVSTIAGAMAAPLISTVTPDRLGIMLSTQALVWVALGGRATTLGPFIGALLAVYGQDALAGTLGAYYLLLLGVLFVLSVLFMPAGIAGLFANGDRIRQNIANSLPRTSGSNGVLEVRDLTVRLGGNTIIDSLDLSVEPAEIVCLIGPNGAGKSTLLNVLSGQLSATAGTIRFTARDVTSATAADRVSFGIGRTFQVPSLFPNLSVSEHMALARQEGRPDAYLPQRYQAMETALADVPIEELSLGDRRLLEIGMAMTLSPRILLLDEPAAGLARHEAELLVDDLKLMRKEAGCAIICVEHDMELVRTLADRVVCLHRGGVLSQGTMDEVSADPNVRKSYLGQA